MNQDALKNLLNRIPWGLVLVVYLGALGVEYYQFENAEDSPKLMKQAEIEQTIQQIDVMKKKIKEAQEFERALSQKREEIRALASELSSMRAGLSEDFNVPELIQIVTREATRVGLQVSSFQPSEERKEEYYTEKVFKLKFSGVYVQLLVFLDRIASLQKILRVDGFELSPTSAQSQKYVDLQGTLQILAYRYTGSKADEIGAEPNAQPASTSGTTEPASPQGGK